MRHGIGAPVASSTTRVRTQLRPSSTTASRPHPSSTSGGTQVAPGHAGKCLARLFDGHRRGQCYGDLDVRGSGHRIGGTRRNPRTAHSNVSLDRLGSAYVVPRRAAVDRNRKIECPCVAWTP
jgi:hypothetical protein